MKNNDLLTLLAELDAAPRPEPTASEIDREETLLRQILDDTQRPARSAGAAFRRPLVRRVGFTLAGALAAGGAAFVAVTDHLPGTGAAGPLSSATGQLDRYAHRAGYHPRQGLRRCRILPGHDAGHGQRHPEGQQRRHPRRRGLHGHHAVGRRGLLPGRFGHQGIAMGISPVGALPAHAIALDTYGARGSGDEEFNYVVGMAGSDVKKVVVTDQGKTVRATLQGGRWTAWWPDGQPEGLLTGTFTVTFTDGSSRTVTAKSLTDSD